MSLGFSGRTRPRARYTTLPGGTGGGTTLVTSSANRSRAKSLQSDLNAPEPSVESVEKLMSKQQAKRVLDLFQNKMDNSDAGGSASKRSTTSSNLLPTERGAAGTGKESAETRPPPRTTLEESDGDSAHGMWATILAVPPDSPPQASVGVGSRVYVVYPMWETEEGRVQMRVKTVDARSGQLSYETIDAYDSVTGDRFVGDFSLVP